MNNLLFQQTFDEAEVENIINSIKHKDWLENKNLSGISFIGKESDIKKYLDNLNCTFMIAVLKLPLEMQLTQGSYLLETLASKSHSDAELFTLIDQCNSHIVTFLGIAKMRVNIPLGFRFTEENPSPVEDSFKEKILRIYSMKGFKNAGYRYQNKIILSDSFSYFTWSQKLKKCSINVSDNPVLSSEIEEALTLIKGQFKNHANTVLEQHEVKL